MISKMTKKTLQFICFISFGIIVLIKCSPLSPIGPDGKIPLISIMPDTSVSVNDSFFVYVNTNNPGSTEMRFVWNISALSIHDTLQDSILKISFTNTGKFNVIVTAINRKELASDPDTIRIEVYAKTPTIKFMPMDTVYSVNDTVVFAVSANDTDGLVSKYLWSINGIHFDTTETAQYKYAWNSDSFGDKTLYVKCIDDDGLFSKTITFNFQVVHGRPIVKVMQDTTVFVNDSVILHGSGIDSNGTIEKYLWSFDGHTFDTTTDSVLKTIWPINLSGNQTVHVKVLDDDGLVSDIDSMEVEVLLGAPNIRAMNDTMVMVNDSLILQAFASDTNGVIKNYLWSFDKSTWDTTSDSMIKMAWPINKYGKKILYVKALDDDGVVSNQDSAIITVLLMAPTILVTGDTSVAINDTITLHATASDSNGTIAMFIWTVDGVNFDTTTTGTFKTFWPLSTYGQKPDFVKALETEGILPKNDSIFRGVASVYAVDNDGISSKTAYIILNFHLYRPTVKAMNDTSIAVNDTVQFFATGADTNGTIIDYLWSLDGSTFDTTDVPIYKMIWSPTDFGIKKVYVKIIDNDGLISPLDSARITVHQYAPVVSAICDNRNISDTIISFNDSLIVSIAAIDTNGTINKYFLDIGAEAWDDSTNYPDSMKYVKYPSGGYVDIVVGAKDDDGIMGTDTIHILFNRPPTSCGLKTDYNTDKGGWCDFNYLTNKGTIQVSFTGDDPDGSYDNLKYDLYWGSDQNNLSKQYSGVNTTVSISDIPIQTQFYWKVVARDLYGDSVAQTGYYSSNVAPPAGLFWNLVSNNATFRQARYDMNSLSFTFDGKMWIISPQSITGDYTITNYVYNSTDGITWNLVSNNATFRQARYDMNSPAFTFDGKMWIVSPQSITGDYTITNYVYNSTDGITWNLVSNNATFKQARYDMNSPAFTFDGKMWIVLPQSITGDYTITNYVYNSTDGITWNLVSNNVTFRQARYDMNSPAFTFDGKMWIVSPQSITGDYTITNYVNLSK
jgi:hypothetical protein